MSTDTNTKTIENAHPDDIQPGDDITRVSVYKMGGVTVKSYREGTAHHLDAQGTWRTEEGGWISWGEDEEEDTTITIRRPVQEFPVKLDTVIVPNDGREAIGAVFNGVVYHAREAVLVGLGMWQGVWRSARGVEYQMTSRNIITGTWKEDDQ